MSTREERRQEAAEDAREFERETGVPARFAYAFHGLTPPLTGPDEDDRCVCHTGDGPVLMCLGVPGESDACGPCLRLDPEAPCLAECCCGEDTCAVC